MKRPTTDVRIENVSAIDPNLRDELERWTDTQFGHIRYQWAPSEWYASARLDGHVVGSLTLVTRHMTAAAESIGVAGIGNVVTKPEYRLRGVASAMLRVAADLMRTRLNAEFGVLICRREVAPVYERNEWFRVAGPTRFWQPTGTVTYPDDTMVLKLTARDWPDGPIDLCGLPW
jgi:GNAT superfamily N-acetyltransferase